MNPFQKTSILFFAAWCAACLTACRQEKQERKVPMPEVSKKAVAAATVSAGEKEEMKRVLECIANQMERNRLEVFNVPLNEQASRDRSDAWKYLTCEQFAEPLSGKKWVYARDLLDRYKDATVLEKLVFWRLVELRMYEQGVSGISRYLEEGVDPRVERGMPTKLMALLYSALAEDPATEPDFLASRRAIEMLKKAGAK